MNPRDAENYRRFAEYTGGFLAETQKGFFTTALNGFGDMARIFSASPGLLKYRDLFTSSYQQVLRKYFPDSRVQETMSFQSWYVGLPPELAPGVFSILGYTEHEGVWYPRGGMIAIPEALARCGERQGMELRFGARVDKVMVRDRRVEGVRLADGTEITAGAVVSNINAKTLYLDLIGEEHLPWRPKLGIEKPRTVNICRDGLPGGGLRAAPRRPPHHHHRPMR